MRNFILLSIVFLVFSCTPKIVKEQSPPKPEAKQFKYLWVYKKTINVRTENSANSNKLVSLADGDSVIVLQNDNGWYEIILNDGKKGWIRSDLLGTKNMSVFSKAVAFSDNLKENEQVNLYFDKNIQHKRIFLEFTPNEYSSKTNIENKARNIGKRYQEKVYPGKVTLQVIEPQNQSEYLSFDLPGTKNADVDLPILKFGILSELELKNENELYLEIIVNKNIDNAQLLKEARKITRSFPLTFKSVHLNYKNNEYQCILSFLEDSSGEMYKFNQCI